MKLICFVPKLVLYACASLADGSRGMRPSAHQDMGAHVLDTGAAIYFDSINIIQYQPAAGAHRVVPGHLDESLRD